MRFSGGGGSFQASVGIVNGLVALVFELLLSDLFVLHRLFGKHSQSRVKPQVTVLSTRRQSAIALTGSPPLRSPQRRLGGSRLFALWQVARASTWHWVAWAAVATIVHFRVMTWAAEKLCPVVGSDGLLFSRPINATTGVC